jgi:3',5'-cyclic AMP phosphodiesterase CpdA
MAPARVIVVSDTHLSPAAPQAEANWDAVVRYVKTAAADAVIHLGDLSMHGTRDGGELRHARRQLDRLGAWHAVPGNHDVGDNPWDGAPVDATMDAARTQRWRDIVGADHWALTINGWTLLAINAQLLGSGIADEAKQWAWLEAQVAVSSRDRPTALITHKPLTAPGDEQAAAPPYRFVPQAAERRLTRLLSGRPNALVISGHVHQYRRLEADGFTHLWAPTTWAVLPEDVQPTVGAKRCGLLSVELHHSGRAAATLIEPSGLTQLTLIHDIPNPYGH